MLLSKKNNFIFIHVPKVAGQSVTNALMPFSAMCWQKALSPVVPFRYQLKLYTKLRKFTGITFQPQPFIDHVRAYEVKESLGSVVFNSYFSFAFVRNPWAWVLSLYTYALKNPRHHLHKQVKNVENFEGYLQFVCNNNEIIFLQKEFICDNDGKQIVNYIGKQENLSEDFTHVCKTIGIKATLPVFNVSRKISYKDHYTPETKKIVEKLYEEDIDYFKYSF
jgi:hypothetical protein